MEPRRKTALCCRENGLAEERQQCAIRSDGDGSAATLGSIMDISVIPEDDQKQLFLVLDALIRDYKARKACAQ
ncbi:hypothetical protein [Sphingobacterium sp.]|uniref:hypothetical protein n=1 Tax=Sphingobacterium sp. TaxID=341027 RepID=UPI002FDA48C4